MKDAQGRNIIDFYANWPDEVIRADLETKRHDFGVLCSHLYRDYNVGSIIRNANAFLAKHIYMFGSHRWDRRGAVGAHNYVNLTYLHDMVELEANLSLKSFSWIGLDNIPGAEPLESFIWPKNALIICGEEQRGIPQELQAKCQKIVYIKQYGSVRSLNTAAAAAIAMYSWSLQHGGL